VRLSARSDNYNQVPPGDPGKSSECPVSRENQKVDSEIFGAAPLDGRSRNPEASSGFTEAGSNNPEPGASKAARGYDVIPMRRAIFVHFPRGAMSWRSRGV
jgi:hypothetical protein